MRRTTPGSLHVLIRPVCLLLLCAWVACASPAPPHYIGTWQSNEPRTLEQVELASLTDEQRRIFEEPGFWGQLRLTYEESRVLIELSGTRYALPYRTVATHGSAIDIEHVDPVTGNTVIKTLIVRGNELWMPVRDLGFYEIFTRVE